MILSDREQVIAECMKEIMEVLEIETTDSTKNTPSRVAKMLVKEVFAHRNNKGIEKLDNSMRSFSIEGSRRDLVILKDIPFYSICEHHFMPFSGKADIGYLPSDKIIGLSKIPRIVKFFSKKPQLQERLGQEIGDYLAKVTNADIVIVRLHDCKHTCVEARGIEVPCSTDTLYTKSNLGERYLEDYLQDFYKRTR